MQTRHFGLTIAASLVLALALLPVAQAATKDFMDGFKLDTVQSILTEMKGTDFQPTTVEGDPRLIFKMGKTNVLADLYQCQDQVKGCKVLQFLIIYDPVKTDTVENVNKFNLQYLYGKAALDPKDGLISYRMVNGNAGCSRDQLKSEFANFIGVTEVLLKHMKDSSVVAQLPGAQVTTNLSAPLPALPEELMSRLASAPRNSR